MPPVLVSFVAVKGSFVDPGWRGSIPLTVLPSVIAKDRHLLAFNKIFYDNIFACGSEDHVIAIMLQIATASSAVSGRKAPFTGSKSVSLDHIWCCSFFNSPPALIDSSAAVER